MITHLVDSDVAISYLNRRVEAQRRLEPLIGTRSLATSVVVVGELREGALGARDPLAALTKLDDFLSGIDVIAVEMETVEVFAELRLDLRRRGELIQDHDLWIAATAIQHDLALVTNDDHFDRLQKVKRA